MLFYTHFEYITRADFEIILYVLKVFLSCRMFNCIVYIDSLFYRTLCCTALTLASPTVSSVLLNQLPKYFHVNHEYVLPFVLATSLLFNLIIVIYKKLFRIPHNKLLNENNLLLKVLCSIFCIIIGMDDIFSIHRKNPHRVQETLTGSLFMGFMSVGLGTFISSVVKKVNRGIPHILENPTLDYIAINIMVTVYYFYKDIGGNLVNLKVGSFASFNLYIDELFLIGFATIYTLIYLFDILLFIQQQQKQQNNKHQLKTNIDFLKKKIN